MRCPHCGYISFDYLDTCKGCGNNLTSTRDLLNIAPVKPKPLFLLAPLVGAEEMLDLESSEAEVTPETTVEPPKEISLDMEQPEISLEVQEEKPETHK
ncbi:MAG TPA: hypothetical protein EYP21_00465 [Syntrophaceae bacterium]|nr:hypothetical protein [Syntrophaceae bacterium]